MVSDPCNNCFFYTQRGTKDKIDKRDSMYSVDSVCNSHKAEPVDSSEWNGPNVARKILCNPPENLDKINSVNNDRSSNNNNRYSPV